MDPAREKVKSQMTELFNKRPPDGQVPNFPGNSAEIVLEIDEIEEPLQGELLRRFEGLYRTKPADGQLREYKVQDAIDELFEEHTD